MTGLAVGHIVHFVLDRGIKVGEHRPAIVTRVENATTADLHVFTSPEDALASFVVDNVKEGPGKKMAHGSFHAPEKTV